MNHPAPRRPPHPRQQPPAAGTVYRSGTATARTRRRTELGRLALALLLIVSATAAVLVGYHLTTVAAHAAGAGPKGSGTGATASRSDVASGGTSAGNPAGPSAVVPATPGPVTVSVDGFLSWALMNRKTGATTGSANDASATSTTESMIKAWIASDYLRRLDPGTTPSQQRLGELTTMIRDSDDQAAEDIYRLDGLNDVVNRMISICGLTDTTVVDGWWSKTQVTASDAARLGLCVADGRAAGPTWTNWILTQMRQVRGEGRFGIIDALPADVAGTTAIKNGWTLLYDDGQWHIACLAVQDQWILSVLTRYDGSRGLSYGAKVCENVARQALTSS